jgi:hypothetical protein
MNLSSHGRSSDFPRLSAAHEWSPGKRKATPSA